MAITSGLEDLCRVCLSENMLDSVPLFRRDSAKFAIVDKLRLCTGVAVNREECLPQRLCRTCLDELNTADRFRAKCLTSDKTLQAYLRRCNVEREPFDKLVQEEHLKATSPIEVLKEEREDDHVADCTLETLPTRSNNHVCPQCGKALKTESTLVKHIVSMHKQRQSAGRVSGHGASRLYHCKECEYTTRHSQSLVYHVRRHTGERPHSCSCGATFTQPAALAAHAHTHTDRTSHTCATCGKQFKFKESFERHQLVHSESKFSCVACGKRLKTQSSLRSHMNRHMGLRNFKCEHCGMTFVTSAELANHRRKHDISLRDCFQCHLCTYKTYAKKGLVLHLKRHTGERPFKCGVCTYAAHTRGQLTTHTRTHTREKRYVCASCGQRFVHSYTLKKHIQRAHTHQHTPAVLAGTLNNSSHCTVVAKVI